MSDEVVIPSIEEGEQPKRKRGRPAKVKEAPPVDGAQPIIDEKKRGRKPKKKEEMDPKFLGRQLVGLHLIAVKLTHIPEIAIDGEEGELLAEGIIGVIKEYDISVNGKTGAWLGLIGAAAMVYAPRAVVIAEKRKQTLVNHETTQG